MTWSYSGDPGTNALDAVRFQVQDTIQTDQLLQDEEITQLLEDADQDVPAAALVAARAIAARFARLAADVQIDDLRISYSTRAREYRALITRLEQSADEAGVPVPYAGGIDPTDKQLNEDERSTTQGTFRRGIHDSR